MNTPNPRHNHMKPLSLFTWRKFFTDTSLSLRWLAHLSLVKLLIICIVLLPSMATNAAFTDISGNYTIQVDAGRAGHTFMIMDAAEAANPNGYTGNAYAGLSYPGAVITGNYPSAPNGMAIRDMVTNQVALLPDNGNGAVALSPGAWTDPSGANTLSRVYFTFYYARAGHQLAVQHPNGTTYLAEPYSGSSYSTSALIDPNQSFRIVDITTGERCEENVTYTDSALWEPNPAVPVANVTILLDVHETGSQFTVHSIVPNGVEMLQSVTAVSASGSGILGGDYYQTYDWGWAVSSEVAKITAPIGWGASFWITRDVDGAAQGSANPGGPTNPFVLNPQYVAENRPMVWPLLGVFPPPPTVTMSFYLPTSYPTAGYEGPNVYVVQPGGTTRLQGTYSTGSISDLDEYGGDHSFYYTEYTANVLDGQPYWLAQIDSSINYLTANPYEHFVWYGWTPIHGPLPPDSFRILLPPWRMSASSAGFMSIYRGVPVEQSGAINKASYGSATTVTETLTNPWTGTERTVTTGLIEASLSLSQGDPNGWYLKDETRGEYIPLHTGENDLRNWTLPATEQPVQISVTRWDHDLRIRCENGSEYPLFKTFTQGDLTQILRENTTWYNPYYYFDATAQIPPDAGWFVWDETTQEMAAAGTSDLINWIAVRPPVLQSITQPIPGVIRLEIQPYSGQDIAFVIERKRGNANWARIGYEVFDAGDGVVQFEDWAISQTGIYHYRIRSRFGGIESGPSNERSENITVLNVDSDGDSLPDSWEMQWFHTLNGSATDDHDGDYFTMLDEYQRGNSPWDYDFIDADGDGLQDPWETAHGFDPTIADEDGNTVLDGNDDTDSDGMENRFEARYNFDHQWDDAWDDADADGYPNVFEVKHLASPRESASVPMRGTSGTPPHLLVDIAGNGDHWTIQDALDEIDRSIIGEYGIVDIASGTYFGAIEISGYPVMLRAVRDNPVDSVLNGPVVLDGEMAHRVLDIKSSAALDGLVVTRGVTSVDGGGIRVADTKLRVTNCVIRDCFATRGGGLAALDSRVWLVHCTLFNNQAQGIGGDIFADDTSYANVQHSIFGNSVETPSIEGLVDTFRCLASYSLGGADDIEAEAELTEAGRLRSTSPAREATLNGNQILRVDAGGTERNREASDLGAHEFIDEDEDGLPDDWERAHFGDLAQSGLGDFDSDNISNEDEFASGMNPATLNTDTAYASILSVTATVSGASVMGVTAA